jgi:hypothetical protein
MAQQTAVEWLYRWYNDNQEATIKECIIAFEQAKAMEKEQIIDAHNHGEYNSQFMDVLDDINGIEYYNKTYNK